MQNYRCSRELVGMLAQDLKHTFLSLWCLPGIITTYMTQSRPHNKHWRLCDTTCSYKAVSLLTRDRPSPEYVIQKTRTNYTALTRTCARYISNSTNIHWNYYRDIWNTVVPCDPGEGANALSGMQLFFGTLSGAVMQQRLYDLMHLRRNNTTSINRL